MTIAQRIAARLAASLSQDPERYAKKKSPSLAGQGEFRWITIGGEAIEGQGNHHGGTHVQIRSSTGEIVSGPSALEGKKVDELGKKNHSPDAGKKVAEKPKKPVERKPAESKFDPSQHVKISAEDITKLRKQDVYRVLEWAQKEHRQQMADYITKNRPELSEEVADVMEELEPDAKPEPGDGKPEDESGRKSGYFNGDRIEYTGKMVDGFHEFEYMEGHKQGQTGVTAIAPDGTSPHDGKFQEAWKKQQEEFGRLHKPDDNEPNAPEAEPEKAAGTGTPLERMASHEEQIRKGTASADQVRQWFKEATSPENVEALKAELNKKTVQQLKEMGAGGYHAAGMKKGDLVENLIDRIHGQYHVGESLSFSPFQESRQDALKKAIESQTDEHIKAYSDRVTKATEARKAEIEKIVNAIKNPQTLEDFETRQRFAKDKTLTPEMQERYDELVGTTRKAKETEKAATVQGVTGVSGLTAEIKEGFHAKKQQPTYVAVVNQRVERDKYAELLGAAKKLGGYYSSFRGSGAIPGFQFDSKEAAEKFRDIVHGNSVDRSDILEDRKEAKSESRASTLRERAEAIASAAEEDLNRDRKTNTHRRADMAAGINARNRAKLAQAETMRKIADGMEKGELKHLDGVNAATHVEQLDATLRRAQQNAIRHNEKTEEGKQWDYRKREAEWEREPSADDIAHAEYPHPRVWSSELIDAGEKLANVPGLKNAARTLAGIGKQTISAKFASQGNGIKFSGGSRLDPTPFEGLARITKTGKQIRVHQTYDTRFTRQNGGQPAHTADGGKTWGTTPETAVAGAIRAGHDLDLVDPPQHESVPLTGEKEIDALAQVAAKLKNHPNRDLRRLGESAAGEMAKYNRMQQMGIKSLPELRAALREFHGLRTGAQKEDPIKVAERKLIGRKIDGFFPTPKTIVDRMLDEADIRPGMSVLEPSAGKGDILDMIRDRHGDSVKTHAIEPNGDLREIIGLKGHDVGGLDFMEERGNYDRIVMNPPFENGKDIAHVKHAFDRLNPGGKLVAIVTNGGGKKREEFDQWVQENDGQIESLPEKSFASAEAFRQTGVNTRMIVIQKPQSAAQKYSRADAIRDRVYDMVERYTQQDSPAYYARQLGMFDESQHPRDAGGLFSTKASTAAKTEPTADEIKETDSKPVAKPAPGVAGQQQSLFGGKAPAGGQQSLFNVAQTSKPKKSSAVAEKIAGRLGELLGKKDTISPADLSVPLAPASLPGQRQMFARSGNPERYEKRWITLGKKGEENRTRIQIDDDGRVTAGPPSLKGDNISTLGDKSQAKTRTVKATHARAEGKTGRDYTTAQAIALGLSKRLLQFDAAKSAGRVSRVATHSVIGAMQQAHDFLTQQADQRERAKERARKLTRLNAGVIASIENAHRDHSSVPGFDEAAHAVASEHPELGFDPDDTDTPAKVWELIREGASPVPALHSPEVAALAAEWQKPLSKTRSETRSKTLSDDGIDWDAVPFSRSEYERRTAT